MPAKVGRKERGRRRLCARSHVAGPKRLWSRGSPDIFFRHNKGQKSTLCPVPPMCVCLCVRASGARGERRRMNDQAWPNCALQSPRHGEMGAPEPLQAVPTTGEMQQQVTAAHGKCWGSGGREGGKQDGAGLTDARQIEVYVCVMEKQNFISRLRRCNFRDFSSQEAECKPAHSRCTKS